MHSILTEDPNLAVLLAALGIAGIYTEACGLGRVVPGVLGVTFLIAGVASLASHRLYWPGLVGMASAFVALLLEAVFASRGLLTIAGLALMMWGVRNLIAPTDPAGQVRWIAAVVVSVPLAPATSFLLSLALRARRNKRRFTSLAAAGVILNQTRESEAKS